MKRHTAVDTMPAKAGQLVALKETHRRNEIMPLRPELFERAEVNLSAAQRRVSSLAARRTVKKAWQAAWLVKAIEVIDLTTLSGDDTPGRVHRLCAKARNPLRHDLVEALGLLPGEIRTGLPKSAMRSAREQTRSTS